MIREEFDGVVKHTSDKQKTGNKLIKIILCGSHATDLIVYASNEVNSAL
ncbi:hypothetical protein HUE58_02325 [Candidatus Ruthia endofausta]|uniref:Uncharacterized protein n=1 Tax=Candidatus Ruthia endofausta TaxID=2738852 RepID=A0A6N0HNX8_9GAMM|nr:hypothetical protein [Candidatus Ruthia endofausta]QKQ24020.1 hypothetical protein HUE58_02325 [Candidatus Ruthia endofausta]